MKQRTLALFLLLSLVLAPLAQASEAMGWELHKAVTVLGDGVTVTQQVMWGDSKADYRREQYLTYTPGGAVTPLVVYGATVPTRATLTTMAQDLERHYGYRVLGGANGDYFVMSTGVPLGAVITWGGVRTSSSYHYAVGFREDGSAFIGKPEMEVWADIRGIPLLVAGGLNKSRTAAGGYALFSADFGAATGAKDAGVDVILRPVSVPEGYTVPDPVPRTDPDTGEALPIEDRDIEAAMAYAAAKLPTLPAQLTVGGALTCVVEEVRTGSSNVSIPQDRFVLSIDLTGPQFQRELLEGLKRGELLELSITTKDERWSAAVSAIGAYAQILQNGQVPSGLEQTAAPRTALGIREDGSVLLYTMDGRQPGHSVGASVSMVAKRLRELGCVDAVLFDGGGSTAFGTTHALGDAFTLDSKPSDGAERSVTNALFFVSKQEATGVAGSLYLEPHDGLLLSGAQVKLSAQCIDTAFYPMRTAPGQVTYTAQGPGTIQGSVLTAGSEKGQVVVTGDGGDGVTGQALFTVIKTPAAIRVSEEQTGREVTELALNPWDRVDLTAAAVWYKLPLESDDSCFTWSCDPAIGVMDQTGAFTAGPSGGSGAITVSAGGCTAQVNVTVASHVRLLENCEGNLWTFGSDTALAVPSTDQVKLGRQSLEVVYPTDQTSRVAADLPVAYGEGYLGCWVYGDGSETLLEVELELDDGARTTAKLSWGGFDGWKKVLAPIPQNTLRMTGITITPAAGATGTLYLDHLISANAQVYDNQAPAVSLTVDGDHLAATLQDNVDQTFNPYLVSVTLDGQALPFELSGARLTAALPQGGGAARRVSVTVTDASGNIGRASWQGAADWDHPVPFADTLGHWAEPYATYLYDHGIAAGSWQDGTLCYFPDQNITRAEFATMLCRWMGLDVNQYSFVELPFADAKSIPAYAKPALQALYLHGIFNGSAEQGQLLANPNHPLTRTEAMAMLGRVQPKGYPPASARFTDHDAIPAWAVDHVYALVGQGVVSGYQGAVRPGDPITRGEAAKLFTTLW